MTVLFYSYAVTTVKNQSVERLGLRIMAHLVVIMHTLDLAIDFVLLSRESDI